MTSLFVETCVLTLEKSSPSMARDARAVYDIARCPPSYGMEQPEQAMTSLLIFWGKPRQHKGWAGPGLLTNLPDQQRWTECHTSVLGHIQAVAKDAGRSSPWLLTWSARWIMRGSHERCTSKPSVMPIVCCSWWPVQALTINITRTSRTHQHIGAHRHHGCPSTLHPPRDDCTAVLR